MATAEKAADPAQKEEIRAWGLLTKLTSRGAV